MDTKVKGGDKIPGKSTKQSTTEPVEGDQRSYIKKVAGQLQQCIGDLCFPVIEDGKRIIEVNVNEDTNPECAELIRDIIGNSTDSVRFNLKTAQLISTDRPKEEQIVELEKRLKDLKS